MKLAPHPPGYVVEASSPKISEGVHKFLEDRLDPVEPSVPARRTETTRKHPTGMTVRDVQVAELTMGDIKDFICPSATDQEAFMFLKLCQARNLNPFTNEAYLVKYGSKTSMIVGKEAFTRKAELNPQFDGFSAGIIVKQKDGTFADLVGTFYDDAEDKLVGGWAEVKRKDRSESFIQRISLKEYSKGQATWKEMPAVMIRKVALVNALREAFPTDLSGCYTSDELGIDPAKEVAV